MTIASLIEMKKLHIITPVKDSIDTTIDTINAIVASEISIPTVYTLYNDFSTDENTARLKQLSETTGFELINLCNLTDHPSPNYLLTLQTAQEKALADEADLLIVESDVEVGRLTIQQLWEGAHSMPDCGLAAAVTVDEKGKVNYPYTYAAKWKKTVIENHRHCSFCCTLLTHEFLSQFDFHDLDPSNHWHDVKISHKSLKLGFKNYLFMTLPVHHRPNSSRPWKQLKHSNPLLYYWRKYTKGLDKI